MGVKRYNKRLGLTTLVAAYRKDKVTAKVALGLLKENGRTYNWMYTTYYRVTWKQRTIENPIFDRN